MRIRYFREPSGDYLCVDLTTRGYYEQIGKLGLLEGRATAIEGDPSSMCTTGIHMYILTECTAVFRRNVPSAWLRYL